MADGDLRLFAAIGLPESAREELRRVGEAMRAFAPDGTRWMDVAGAHLTLQFIGNRPADDVAMIDAALTQASSRHAPFELSLAGVGVFPSRGRASCALGRGEGRPRRAGIVAARRVGCARGDGLRSTRADVQPAPDGVQDTSRGTVGRARRIQTCCVVLSPTWT